MKVVFITNYINHHQIGIADELYKHLGKDYAFIATTEVPQFRIALGYPDYSERPYLLKAYLDENKAEAQRLADEADVVIIGAAPDSYIKKRLAHNKLTFRYSERWFKKNYYRLLFPPFWLYYYNRHTKYRNRNLYMLCASAYTSSDVAKVFAYPDKCFKWGYFTHVGKFDFEASFASKQGTMHILWCARFLVLKHPELPVKLAKRLKDAGYSFVIDMFGSGEEFERTKQLAKELDVEDAVAFRGNVPNAEILEEMRKHDIFLFTSDRNEGWGAVLNEAMSSGCAVVASNEIGSVPFLVKHNENGLIFESENIDSLFANVKYLMDNPQERYRMSKSACETMLNVWSPENAAKRLLQLINGLLNGQTVEFVDGPCSKAK
jgi:glycosyltransferase involved in cell wall biosynthesis